MASPYRLFRSWRQKALAEKIVADQMVDDAVNRAVITAVEGGGEAVAALLVRRRFETVLAAGVPMEASFGDGGLSSSCAGDKGGRIWAARKKDGGKIASRDLPSPPVWDGLAAARGNCIIALKDGTVLCLR